MLHTEVPMFVLIQRGSPWKTEVDDTFSRVELDCEQYGSFPLNRRTSI